MVKCLSLSVNVPLSKAPLVELLSGKQKTGCLAALCAINAGLINVKGHSTNFTCQRQFASQREFFFVCEKLIKI